MHHTPRARIAVQYTYYTYAFWALLTAIVLMVASYVYLVNATIFHTAERQRLEDAIIDTKSVVSQLELARIDAHRNVTRAYAAELGFVEAPTLVFVERDSTVSLSLHEVER